MRNPRALLWSCLAVLLVAQPGRAESGMEARPESSEPELCLRAGYRGSSEMGHELFGLVTVSVPFEALLGRTSSSARWAQDPETTPGALKEEAASPRALPATATQPSPLPPPPLPQLELTPQLARDAVRVALQLAGANKIRDRLRSLRSRGRSAALLPDLRLRGGRITDESLRWAPTDSDAYRFTQAGGTRLFAEMELSWRFGHLLYSDAELRVETLWQQHARWEREVTERVLSALFEWQKARLRCADPTLEPHQRGEALVIMVRAAAELDVLTNGWFVRHTRGAADPPS